MNLYEQSVKNYGDLLASSDPAPGGGTAAALAGLQGAALTAMVAQLTLGRKKYAEHEALCKEVLKEALDLQERFTQLMEEDARAYIAVAAAYKLPKASEEEKCARSAAICQATEHATEIPFETMTNGLAGLRLAEKLLGKSNENAASDLGVAALNLESCVFGACLNVVINLPGLKDKEKESAYIERTMEIVKEARLLRGKICSAVIDELILDAD